MPRGKPSRYTKYKKYGMTTLNVANKALNIALKTKRLINVEYKFKDTQHTPGVGITQAGIVQDLVTLAQGTTVSTREGDQVKFVSLYLNYFGDMSASATASTVRVVIVHDKQPNGATATNSQIFDDATVNDLIISPKNLGNKFRFKILYNKLHQMSINGNQNFRGSKYIKLNMLTRYSGSAGTIADITTNNIQLWFIGDEATNEVAVRSFCRLRYIDN